MKKHVILIILFCSVLAKAQTLKPDVFVVGNNNAAVAAAIQSAQSNVKTILLLQAAGFDIAPIEEDLSGGIQQVFLEKMAISKNDTTKASPSFDKHIANEVLTKWTDSIKNLTVIKNVMWIKADRAGSGWVFKLSDGKTIRPEVLINVADRKLNDALKISMPQSVWSTLDYAKSNYKTNVATGRMLNNSRLNRLMPTDFLVPNQENLVYVQDANSMLAGQSAGAIAAYAGFFDVKTSAVSLRKTQGELLAYKANLMPFADVKAEDKSWKAIQMVGLTGVLKGEVEGRDLFFKPDTLVSALEIKQAMKDHFYKAQIWFDDYKNDMLTVSAVIDMICYVGNKAPESTRREIQKKWSTDYMFTQPFDLSAVVTRKQLVVLLQEYCPPFNVTIDKNGEILR